MSGIDIDRLFDSPAYFRSILRIDNDSLLGVRVGTPFGEVLDDWQAADFAALDPALRKVANLQYPIRVRTGPDILTSDLVSFTVAHSDFISQTVHFDLGPEQAKITMTPGTEVVLSAADANGKPIEGFGVMMAGENSPVLWAKGEDGSLRSRAVKNGTWQTMLVKLQDDGPTLFSTVLSLPVREGQRLRFRNLELQPGTVLHGKLSDNVPRPVKGYVMANSVPGPPGNSSDANNPPLNWYDWIDIQPDGEFVFPSLPSSGLVQLIAVCDGWISVSESDESDPANVTGQMFEVNDKHLPITLMMGPTGILEVALVTADGQPFTQGKITSLPGQHYYKGGSTTLGQRFRSGILIKNQMLPLDRRLPHYVQETSTRYEQDVSPSGTATLTGFPVNRRIWMSLLHDSFRLEGERSFTVESAEPAGMQVRVVPAKGNQP